MWQISISFINICIYFYSLQKYPKYQLPSHFLVSLWDLHVCMCGSLAHARKHRNICLQIRWSPILSRNKCGSKSMVQILYLNYLQQKSSVSLQTQQSASLDSTLQLLSAGFPTRTSKFSKYLHCTAMLVRKSAVEPHLPSTRL